MTKKSTWIVLCLLALAPVALVAACYGALPDRVPTYWGLDGTVTYGPKALLWLFALLSPALTALLRLLPRLDPRRGNYARFQRCYDGFCAALLLFLLTLTAVTLVESLRPGTLSVGRVVTLALGVLLAFLGNRLPKVKSNFFLGFRTPWTLSDPDVWNRTHRAGGILFFALGAALVPCGLFLPEQAAFGVLLAGVLAASLTPVVLSYIWYRQKVDKDGRR